MIAQLRSHLPQGWDATLHAVDGATTRDVPAQLARAIVQTVVQTDPKRPGALLLGS